MNEPTTTYRVDRWDTNAGCWSVVRVGIASIVAAVTEARVIADGGHRARVIAIEASVAYTAEPATAAAK